MELPRKIFLRHQFTLRTLNFFIRSRYRFSLTKSYILVGGIKRSKRRSAHVGSTICSKVINANRARLKRNKNHCRRTIKNKLNHVRLKDRKENSDLFLKFICSIKFRFNKLILFRILSS